MASASDDRTARVSDMCGNELRSYVAHDVLADVKFSPDQNHLMIASVDKTISINDWRTGSLVETLLGHADSCYGIDVLPTSHKLLSASLDNKVKLWSRQKIVAEVAPKPNFGYSLERTLTGHEVRARLLLNIPC